MGGTPGVSQAGGTEGMEPTLDIRGGGSSFASLPHDSFTGYEIIREIHRGGQGVIYQAVQKSTKRKVAIKVMKEGPFAGSKDKGRFEREVEILGQLKHPNIVNIHDSGVASGSHYFVMDYISGQPLDVWMAGGEWSIDETLELFARICEAVNAAHLKGIIHRDLKPGNIRIDSERHPHILDFGLAKVATGSEASLMTMTGQFIGSLPWASPEQAEGVPDKIDTRTDVYALGVILYQMLTGKFPYEVVGNMRDVLDRIMKVEPARPSTIRRQINDEVETIVLKCLGKERERRYQTAGELARDIGHYLKGEPIEAKRDSTFYVVKKGLRRHRAAVGVVASFLVVAAVALIVSVTAWRLAVTQRDRADAERLRAETATTQVAAARDRAEQAKARATERAEQLRRTLYANQIALAESAYRDNSISQMKRLLEEAPTDLCGWEWYQLKALSDRSLKTLSGHEACVNSVSFSRDGRRIVSGSEDGTARLWDAETGAELRTLRGQNSGIKSVAFSPDGGRVVSGSEDGTMRLWDTETGRSLSFPSGHRRRVASVSFSPDGRQIASASYDETVVLWDAGTGVRLRTLYGHEGGAHAVSFSPDGQRIASGSYHGIVKLWDTQTGAPLPMHMRHAGRVSSLSFDRGGKVLSSGSTDGTVRLWNADTGEQLWSFRRHNHYVWGVSFSPDDRQIVSGGADKMVKLWDAQTGQELCTLRGHDRSVMSVGFSPDGRRVVSGSEDGTARLWDARNDSEEFLLRGHQAGVHAVSFSPDGQRIASGGGVGDCSVRLWDARIGAELCTLRGNNSGIQSVAFSADGSRVVSGSEDGTMRLWDAETGAELREIRAHDSSIRSIGFGPDDKRIVSGGNDKKVKLWHADTGAELRTMRGHANPVQSVCFSPDGRQIVSSGGDWIVRLWECCPSAVLYAEHEEALAAAETAKPLAEKLYQQLHNWSKVASAIRANQSMDAAVRRQALNLVLRLSSAEMAASRRRP